MPELPKIEYAQRLLTRFFQFEHILQKISYPDANVLSKYFINCISTRFTDGLINHRKILDIQRHEKYLWFEMAN
ncbi:unnamed protein product [Rotaria sordida]|uniref:Formamidopyrimidine-DNA glycosylase catalytic domain-containing protein n=1 Tax=Rotaria sordida TaxID=392033 RepID=A0A818J1X9_9BILA|nr:unnamed protein product [Rotaria sordida]